MATPLDEIQRLRAERDEILTELNTLRGLVQAHLEADVEAAHASMARHDAQAAYQDGYEQGTRDEGERQFDSQKARAWAEALAVKAGEPSFTELEERRWGPGGREHAADPRPGDYQGREPYTE